MAGKPKRTGPKSWFEDAWGSSRTQHNIWAGWWGGALNTAQMEGRGGAYTASHGAGWGTTAPLRFGASGLGLGLRLGLGGAAGALGLGGGGLLGNIPLFGSNWRQIRKEEVFKRQLSDTLMTGMAQRAENLRNAGGFNAKGNKKEENLRRWLHKKAKSQFGKKASDDSLESYARRYRELTGRKLKASEAADIAYSYRRKWNVTQGGDGRYSYKTGPRGFGARGARDHIKQGAKSYFKNALFSKLAWGVNLGLAVYDSSNNLFDPKTGFATALTSAFAAEAGFMMGGTLASAALTIVMPGLGALGWIGYGAGALAGAMAGASIVDIPLGIAQMGKDLGRHRRPFKSAFQDSQEAQTMRQRSVQAIYRSQMSARSAFGNEALSYHA